MVHQIEHDIFSATTLPIVSLLYITIPNFPRVWILVCCNALQNVCHSNLGVGETIAHRLFFSVNPVGICRTNVCYRLDNQAILTPFFLNYLSYDQNEALSYNIARFCLITNKIHSYD